MFDRFSEPARQSMSLARQAAQRFWHDYIGTEHMLFGLVDEGGGVAARVLRNLKIEPDAVRAEVEKIVKPGTHVSVIGQIPFTPRAKRVLELSLEAARALGHDYIGTEHLLLGLVDEKEGIAAQVLRRLGATAERVRAEVIRLLGETAKARPGADAGPSTARERMPLAGMAIPILPMRDVQETAAFYRRLGFRVTFEPTAVREYAFAERGDVVIHFFANPGVDPKKNDAGCYVRVKDADALHAEFLAAGIEGLAAIEDKPWGMREFHVVDPNGNLLRIGHRRT